MVGGQVQMYMFRSCTLQGPLCAETFPRRVITVVDDDVLLCRDVWKIMELPVAGATCKNAISALSKRMKACIKANGGPFNEYTNKTED